MLLKRFTPSPLVFVAAASIALIFAAREFSMTADAAVLSPASRAAVAAAWHSEHSRDRLPIPLSKVQVAAAVDAADAWVDANMAAYNSALPAAARNNLSARDKARLLTAVINQRFVETP